jgi:hypothetical protein
VLEHGQDVASSDMQESHRDNDLKLEFRGEICYTKQKVTRQGIGCMS